jgi:sarcosine oxidase
VSTYDVVIVGAGGMGTAAAYQMARDGRRVLLLEQFRIGHKLGSSHGGSRIIRHSHAEPEYATLAPHAFALWRELEAESGVQLLQETGGLDFGPADYPPLVARAETMATLGYPHQVLDLDALAERFPQFRLPAGWGAVYHPGAGILSADLAVETMAARALAHGAVLQEESRVLSVEPQGGGVVITLDGPNGRERIEAGQAVITAGPWMGHFLQGLDLAGNLHMNLKVTHQQVVYFEVERHALDLYSPAACPIFIFLPMPHFYGFPIWEQPGQIKIGLELTGEGIEPDSHTYPVLQEPVDELCELVATHMAGVIPKATSVTTCLYTLSPDQNFIIDRHPAYPQILLAAGFSGRGFKFTILTGRLLAELATSAPGTYHSPLWRDCFRIDRLLSAPPVNAREDLLKL